MDAFQRTEYASATPESTALMSRARWRLVLAALALTIIGGIALASILLAGAANPPYAPRLALDVTPHAAMPLVSPDTYFVGDLSPNQLPITIEASARSARESAWGIWISASGTLYPLRLRADGYFSRHFSSGWQNFLHIQPTTNTLYLYVDPQGNSVFRINHEIAWTGTLPTAALEWGILQPPDSSIDWRTIRLYDSG